MAEPRILSVCWLPKEQLKEKPDRITITDDQLNELTKEDEIDDESEIESDENELDEENGDENEDEIEAVENFEKLELTEEPNDEKVRKKLLKI